MVMVGSGPGGHGSKFLMDRSPQFDSAQPKPPQAKSKTSRLGFTALD